MKLKNFLLGRADFKTEDQIIEQVKSFPRFETNLESLEDADAILVFKSDTQKAWLVFTNARMYYVLDDVENGESTVEWARDRENMIKDHRVDLHMKEEPVSNRTGLVTFNTTNHGFYYTKSLFPSRTITGHISFLLNKHFSDDL